MKYYVFYLFASLVLSAGLVACGGETDSKDTGLTCETSADCSDGSQCHLGQCRAASGDTCASDLDCAAYEYCGDGTCQLSQCTSTAQCADNAICDNGTCRAGCTNTEDCAAGQVCNPVSFICEDAGCTPNSCAPFEICDDSVSPATCTYDGSCDDDAICAAYARQVDDGNEYICQDSTCVVKPPCAGDSDCSTGEICVQVAEGDNFCRDGCRSDAACGLGKYCNEEELICETGCTSNSDCNAVDGVCVNLVCETECSDRDYCEAQGMVGMICTGSPSYCQYCTDSNQCYGGEFCNLEAAGTPEGKGLCQPLPPPCPEDDFGDNHDRAFAEPLTQFPTELTGAERPQYCKIHASGEWFTLTADPGQVIEIEIEYDNAGNNLDVALLDADGNDLMISGRSPDEDGGVERIVYGVSPELAGPTEFYVHVRGSINDDAVAYRLLVDVRAPQSCADDGFEPNNSTGTATDLPGDNAWNRDLEACGDDADFYNLEVSDNQLLTVSVQAMERLGAVEVSLYKDGLFLMGADRDEGSPNVRSLSYSTVESGTIVLKVEVAQGVGRVEYDVAWNAVANECTDVLEGTVGNDQCSNAVTLDQGMTYANLAVCSRPDYYKVTLLPNDRLLATAIFDQNASEGTLLMSLFGPNNCGTLLTAASSSNIPGTSQVKLVLDDPNATGQGFKAEVGGDYYILVERLAGLQVAYSLQTQVTSGAACVDDAYDDTGNDTPQDAVSIDPALVVNNGPQSVILDLKTCDFDLDWYSIDVAAGDTLTWEIAQAATSPGIGAALIDSDGATPVTDGSGNPIVLDSNGQLEVTNTTSATKTYYLRVAGANGIPVRKTYRLLTYINGSGTADPVCPGVYENNDDKANARDIGTGNYSSLLSCDNDEDWYKTLVAAGETISVTVNFQHADGNIGLSLFDDSGSAAPQVDSHTVADSETVTYTSARDQYVYYRVDSAFSMAGNSYSMTVSVQENQTCAPDGFEDNDSSGAAAPVAVPGLYSRLTSCEDEDDWYEVDLSAGQLFEAALNFDAARAELAVEIYEPGDLSNPVATGTASGDAGASATYTPTTNGTHYVRVASADPNVSVRLGYDLMLFRDLNGDGTIGAGEGPADRDCPDIFENNDTFPAAAYVPSGTYQDLLLCSGGSGNDVDYYRIFVPTGATLTVDVAFSDALGNIDVILKKADRTQVMASTTRTDLETVSVTNSGLGAEYIVFVRGVRQFRNYYSMDVSLAFSSTCADDAFAGNVDMNSAAALTAGNYPLQLCEVTEDWFEVTVPAGETLTVHAELAQRMGDIDFELQDAAGVVLAASESATNTESIVYTNTATASETYYLRAFSKGGVFIRNAYDLWVQVGANMPPTPYCPGAYERNDTTVTAYVFDIFAQKQLSEAIMCGVEEDWYQVELSGSIDYKLAAFFNHAAGMDLALEIRDTTGASLANVDSADSDEFLTFTPPTSGTYFVGIKQSGADPAAQGVYGLYLNRTGVAACPEDSYEPNNQAFQAKLLTGEGMRGLASCQGTNFAQVDYFKVKAEQTGTIHIEVMFDSSKVQLMGDFDGTDMTAGANRLTYSGPVTVDAEYDLSIINTSTTNEGAYFLNITYE
jgi:hypothetical protein